jgi:erythromycin esterase-like protein
MLISSEECAMDSIALTSNWLDAVRRVRSASWQNYVQQVPQAKPSRVDRRLTDTIEAALHDAGAKPVEPANATTTSPVPTRTTGAHVDMLA